MSFVRLFSMAPSLARLIRKERGGSEVTEGYFAPQAGRVSFVRTEGTDCRLVLSVTDSRGRRTEEKTKVPRSHGEALLDVCAGKIVYERTSISLDGRDVSVDCYLTPGGPNLVCVAFDEAVQAEAFEPPVWFGDEVSYDRTYRAENIAISGPPALREVAPTNIALDAVLDILEPRFVPSVLKRPRVAA